MVRRKVKAGFKIKRRITLEKRRGKKIKKIHRPAYDRGYNKGFDQAYNDSFNIGYAHGVEQAQQINHSEP